MLLDENVDVNQYPQDQGGCDTSWQDDFVLVCGQVMARLISIAVTLLLCWWWPETYNMQFRWSISILLTFFFKCGSHAVAAYSSSYQARGRTTMGFQGLSKGFHCVRLLQCHIETRHGLLEIVYWMFDFIDCLSVQWHLVLPGSKSSAGLAALFLCTPFSIF